jgi:hypothetical protein
MAPDASPFTSPPLRRLPFLVSLPAYLVRFLSPSGLHNKAYLGLRVKSRKPKNSGQQNMQISEHNRAIYGKLVGKSGRP